MDRQRLSDIAHTDHPIAAPVSPASMDRLLLRAARRPDARIVDLGCGRAAWALRALELLPAAHADAVDVSRVALEGARRDAVTRGLSDRIALHENDAARFPHATGSSGDDRARYDLALYDLALCVGASHAFGGLVPTLAAVASLLGPGGTAVVGEGYWQRAPSEAALSGLQASAEDFLDLASTVRLAEESGWATLYAHVSDAAEWDDYEWSWTGSLTRWALDHPDDPDTLQALATAREHRDGWLDGYRGYLGFVCLVLRLTPDYAGSAAPIERE